MGILKFFHLYTTIVPEFLELERGKTKSQHRHAYKEDQWKRDRSLGERSHTCPDSEPQGHYCRVSEYQEQDSLEDRPLALEPLALEPLELELKPPRLFK